MVTLVSALTEHGCSAMQMLRCVFYKALPQVVVLRAVNGQCLKPTPAKRNDERIACLENTLVPAMFLYAALSKKKQAHTEKHHSALLEVYMDTKAGHLQQSQDTEQSSKFQEINGFTPMCATPMS